MLFADDFHPFLIAKGSMTSLRQVQSFQNTVLNDGCCVVADVLAGLWGCGCMRVSACLFCHVFTIHFRILKGNALLYVCILERRCWTRSFGFRVLRVTVRFSSFMIDTPSRRRDRDPNELSRIRGNQHLSASCLTAFCAFWLPWKG